MEQRNEENGGTSNKAVMTVKRLKPEYLKLPKVIDTDIKVKEDSIVSEIVESLSSPSKSITSLDRHGNNSGEKLPVSPHLNQDVSENVINKEPVADESASSDMKSDHEFSDEGIHDNVVSDDRAKNDEMNNDNDSHNSDINVRSVHSMKENNLGDDSVSRYSETTKVKGSKQNTVTSDESVYSFDNDSYLDYDSTNGTNETMGIARGKKDTKDVGSQYSKQNGGYDSKGRISRDGRISSSRSQKDKKMPFGSKSDGSESDESRIFESPWGEPHHKVNISSELLNKRKSSIIEGNKTHKGKKNADNSRNSKSTSVKGPSPEPLCPFSYCCPCCKIVCPCHHSNNTKPSVINTCPCPLAYHLPHELPVYDVCPVFPMYGINSIESASTSPFRCPHHRTPYNVNVVSLSSDVMPDQRRAGVKSHQNWNTVADRDRNFGSTGSTTTSSSSRNISSNRPMSRRPPTIICYICGREYGTASIGIHEKQCLDKWRKENSQLPKNQQRPEPAKPQEAHFQQGAGTSSGTDNEGIPGSGKSDYDLDAINKAAFESAQNQFEKCPKCGRTFMPDRLKMHSKNCRGFHKIA